MEFTFILPKETKKQTIKELLEQEWLIPRKVKHFLRTRKNVLLNGEPAMFHQEVFPEDKITLIFEDTDYDKPEIRLGRADWIEPLFEDEHLIIVNKPASMKTHPNQPDEDDTLLNHLAAYLEKNQQIPFVVHRLDKETSGAILFAKNPVVLPILGRMLEKKEIHRLYEAQISGHLPKPKLTINKPIGRDRHDRRKRIIDERRGQRAITHVTELKQSKQTSWVECILDTGRTHQIRVHLLSIGKPIIGDPLYHPKGSNNQRLMLHAKSLNLIHPFTKEKIHVLATPFLSESY